MSAYWIENCFMIRHLSQQPTFQIPYVTVDLQFLMGRLVLIFSIQHISEAVLEFSAYFYITLVFKN